VHVFVCAFQTVVNKDNIAVLQQQQQQQQQQILPSQQPALEEAVIGQGDAEDQSQSFLRKKEEELRQKREHERQLAEARSKQAAPDTTYAVSPPSGVKAGAAQAPGVVTKLEFVAVTTVPSPTSTVSSSLISAPVRTTVPTTTVKTPQTVTAVTMPPAVATTSYQPVRPLPGAAGAANIPQFYFPLGTPPAPNMVDLDDAVAKLREEFEKLDDGKATKNVMGPVMKVGLCVCVNSIIVVQIFKPKIKYTLSLFSLLL